MKESKEIKFYKVKIIFENLIFYAILIPLLVVTLMVVYQSVFIPDEIPNIFGYKIFIILDKYMDDSVEYGDLAITRNIDPNELKVSDIMAFRNGVNTVTIHKIIDIKEKKEFNIDTNEYETSRFFTMKTLENETVDTKHVDSDKIEGLLIHKISKIGGILFFIQQPKIMAIICIIIVGIGTIAYLIAKKLDERDAIKLKDQINNNENEVEENQEYIIKEEIYK